MSQVESREQFNDIAKMVASILESQIVERNAAGAKLAAAESADAPETLDALLAGATEDERAQKMTEAIEKARKSLADMITKAHAYAKENLVSTLSEEEKKSLKEKVSSLDAQIKAGITLGSGQHENFAEFFELPKGTRSRSAASSTGTGSGISRPRLSKVVLDGKEIADGTFTKLAQELKKIGGKSFTKVGSEMHADALAALKEQHGVESFSDAAGKTVKYTETLDGKIHDIELTFKVSE